MTFQPKFAAFNPLFYMPMYPANFGFPQFESNSFSNPMFMNSELLPNSRKIQKKRSKYQRIDDSIRQKIIDDVTKDGIMLKTAAKKYKINYSSAKSIFHTYRKEGRVNKKAVRERFERKKSSTKKEETSIPLSEDSQATSETDDSPKQAFQSPLEKVPMNATFSSLVAQKSTLPQTVKVESSEASQDLTIKEVCSQDVNKVPTSSYSLSAPVLQQNMNMMQNYMHQANNIKLYEELVKLQRTTPAVLPFMYGKQQPHPQPAFPSFTMNPHAMSMNVAQNQMAASQFAKYQALAAQMQASEGATMMNRYPYQAGVFPVNYGR